LRASVNDQYSSPYKDGNDRKTAIKKAITANANHGNTEAQRQKSCRVSGCAATKFMASEA
jgi:hypothetical protein